MLVIHHQYYQLQQLVITLWFQTQLNVGLASPNTEIKAGMRVTGGTLPAAGVLIASVTDNSN